ncbi:hypothetical protein [Paenibacillus sp. Cedars]|uniref:hypothetical protein n=1 Tax=Paenibacillus sp. Cedars TaxID=1980674 RepID=UPI001162476F|nr:hypothetical protein [Paenibacillus sp. Cedars]AWP25341.1 hypothetical protein B9D94_01190 [Paenibacillus sp. Cedars]
MLWLRAGVLVPARRHFPTPPHNVRGWGRENERYQNADTLGEGRNFLNAGEDTGYVRKEGFGGERDLSSKSKDKIKIKSKIFVGNSEKQSQNLESCSRKNNLVGNFMDANLCELFREDGWYAIAYLDQSLNV